MARNQQQHQARSCHGQQDGIILQIGPAQWRAHVGKRGQAHIEPHVAQAACDEQQGAAVGPKQHCTHLAAASSWSFTLNSPDRTNSMCTGSTMTITANEYLQAGVAVTFDMDAETGPPLGMTLVNDDGKWH